MKTVLPLALLLTAVSACADEPEPDYTRDVYAGYVRGSDAFALDLRMTKFDGDDGSIVVKTTFSVSDPSRADVIPGNDSSRLVPKGPGVVMVRPANGFPVRVRFTEYTAAQLTAGKARYETGRRDKAGTACKTCHGAEGIAADVHERWTSNQTDAALLKVAETGESPYGLEPVNGGDHRWNLTGDERVGVIAYIRSLEKGRQVEFFE